MAASDEATGREASVMQYASGRPDVSAMVWAIKTK